MSVYLAVSSGAFGGNPSRVAVGIKDYPGLGVEWYLNDFRIPMETHRRKNLTKSMIESGAPYCSIHLPYSDCELAHKNECWRAMAVSQVSYCIEFAAELNPVCLTVHIGSHGARPEEVSQEAAVESLQSVKARCQELGLSLLVENLRRGMASEPLNFKAIAERADLGVTFDIGHALGSDYVRKRGGDPLDFIRGIEDRVKTLHVYGIELNGEHLPPEDTRMLEPILQYVSEKTPCSYWVLELHSPGEFTRTYEVIKQMAFSYA